MTIGITLALLVPLTRWPIRTQYLYNWDAANFALATRVFDVTQHQPHPPGYPYFVAMGAALQPVFGDANGALVAVSILLQMGAVAATYLLGRAMFTPGVGIAAALMLVASVTFWTYGGIALAYPALATFSALAALFAYQTVQGRREQPVPVIARSGRHGGAWGGRRGNLGRAALAVSRDPLLLCAASYAIGTGFRPDLALFLLPLLALASYRQPLKKAALALAVAGGGVCLWLVPTALLSGGFSEYLAAFAAYGQTDVLQRYAPTARGLEALAVNVRDTTQYLFFALYFETAVVAAGLVLLLWQRHFSPLLFAAVWVGPMLLFYLLLHVGDPGYVFGVLPALLILGSGGVSLWLKDRGPVFAALAPALLAAVLTGNVLVFFLHERPLTLPGLRARDTSNGARLAYVTGYRPQEVLLVSYDSYKHFRYYLPGYVHSVWLDTTTPDQQVFPVPAGVRWALLTDPSVFALARTLPAEAEPLPGDNWVAKLPVQAGQSLVYERGGLRVTPPSALGARR